MIYASVCSGIEAASVAWEPLGWRPAWFSEIEPFPSAVLAHRFPNVPNLGDMTNIKGDEHGAVDLLVGGTPCQDLSVAGKRMGFGGKRSVLALDFVRLAYESGAKWFVFENVPGLFSSNGGEDFAQLLSLFAGWKVDTPTGGWGSFGIVEQSPGCFGLAWRVLDVQYARVDGFERAIPQRRRRVFIVGYLGDWRGAAQVLFEPEGLLGNSPPRREAREGFAGGAGSCAPDAVRGVARTLRAQSQCSCREDTETLVFDACGNGDGVTCPTVTGDHAGRPTDYTPVVLSAQVASALETTCNDYSRADGFNMVAVAFEPRFVRTTGGQPSDGLQPCLRASVNTGDGAPCVAIADVIHGDKSCNGKGWNDDGSAYTLDTMATQGVMQQTYMAVDFYNASENAETAKTLSSAASDKDHTGGIRMGMQVRRLTPREAERLMGFPDDWTRIPWRNKPAEDCPDGPRYKACGNSMGVNVMRWIGTRIQEVEEQK